MNVRLSAVAAVVSCCLFSCNVQQPVGSKYAKTQNVSALQGGTVTVTGQDDNYLAGTALQIPPRSLNQDTLITVAEADLGMTLPDGATAAGPVAELGPSDATFVHPVTVSLKLNDNVDESRVFVV